MARTPGRHFLQIPGPTNVPDRVLRAIDMPTMDHRGPEFAELGKAVLAGMKRVFKSTQGEVVIYPASGTGAWEAALVNTLSAGDRVLMCETGQFAALWHKLATRLGLDIEFNNISPYRYRADMNLWEYAGSIRYSLLTSRWQPFVKAGYGWVWYRLENAQVNGVPFVPANSAWVKPRRIWPNVWHFGAGLEFVPWKRNGRYFHGAEIAVRLEYARYVQDLGLDLSRIPLEELGLVFRTAADIPGGRATRDDFLIGLTLTF